MSPSRSTTRTGCCGGSSAGAVRAGNATGASAKKGGCSCGGGSSGGGSCGCGCDGCQGQDFVRPRFFAGQLLTEDDLDLLASYVVEKNRLHNRSFFGEGVVCGLMVTCDPCGGGKVAVQPGYALDCCGNDIVVSCTQTLDINALVKRLRIERTGGVDCGDPCADEKSQADQKSNGNGNSTATGPILAAGGRGNVITPKQTTPPPLPPAEYCLFVRYCEQNTDPVSPYATDDPCGVQACEPTRVREGFTFELRCRTCDEKTPDNLFTHISECLGNLVTTERTTRNARSAYLYSATLEPALGRITSPDAKVLVGADRLEAATQARLRVAALPDSADAWTAEHIYDAADSAQTLASLVAAWNTMSAEDRGALENADEITKGVSSAQSSLARLQKVTPQAKVATLIADPFDRDVVAATAERSLLWSDPAQAMKVVPAGERALLSGGIVYSQQLRSSLSLALGRIKANLIDRLKDRGAVTDCTLLRDLNAIVIPDDDPSTFTNAASAISARDATRQLLDALIRYVRECLCSAINPPCPPCDDPAVLLACLRVEGCDVRDICNLERTFVLTPVAFRYWMPFLRSFGNILERLCCPDNRCDPPAAPTNIRDGRALAATTTTQPFARGYVERRSALPLADEFLGAGQLLDPARIAAALPAPLSFSPDNARRLASSTAAVLDVVSLRNGIVPGDLFGMLFTPSLPLPPAGGGAVPPAPPAAPPPAMVEFTAVRKEVDDLKARVIAADERNKKLDARLKKLGG